MQNTMKVLVVFGTRPEAIKMAPVVKELRSENEMEVEVCVTGQHRQMLDQVLSIFKIVPDYDLDIMKQGQDLYDVTARVLTLMKGVLKESKPDLVLVHGDTTTSFAASLAAFYQKLSVGHVEAGLRTHNKFSPWPEEMNRQLTARLATFHFAPTKSSQSNLEREGISPERIFVTGNTVIDAVLDVVKSIRESPLIRKSIVEMITKFGYPISDRIRANGTLTPIVLVTGHRRENFGEGFKNICEGLRLLANKHKNHDIVYPVHMNPNVKNVVHEILGSIKNIFLIPPLDYTSFVYLMDKCELIITDSGGIQEEAPSLGKPVIVLRDTTERPEALVGHAVQVVGTNPHSIYITASKILNNPLIKVQIKKGLNPYGDGQASARISKIIKESRK